MKKNCIVSDKSSANAAIKDARYKKLLDINYRIEQSGDKVYIPIIKPVEGSIIHNFKLRSILKSNKMGKTENAGRKKMALPYVRLGNSIILKSKVSIKTASVYASQHSIDNIYLETGKIKGVKRKPSLKLLYGKGGETKVTEYGIKYVFDLQRVMFSPGNINTRSKMKYMKFTGMLVLDMFCGIGYFSLQVLKNSKPARMIMCDINSDSIYYLKKNIRLNKIESQPDIYTGDSRVVIPLINADYIIMGNFNSVKFLNSALIRSHAGTEISMHYLATAESVNNATSKIIKMARELGYILACPRSEVVKSVGPNYLHVNSIFNVIQILYANINM